jgi:D-3-phosphoglycerate dehydrogenase
MYKILVTAPPVVLQADRYRHKFIERNMEPFFIASDQQVPEETLLESIGNFDGWMLGDDVCNREILSAGKLGRLRAALRWGAGFDNVDSQAARDLGIPIENTPGTFANEVADMALGYLIGLARHLPQVNQGVFNGQWLKPVGSSLAGKKVGIVGLGVIGQAVARRLQVLEMQLVGFDPMAPINHEIDIEIKIWPNGLAELDYLILACPLTKDNFKMINSVVLQNIKTGCKIINVARGGLIDEKALIAALREKKVAAVALDVFEVEPLRNLELLEFKQNLYGSHNASNTIEAVDRTTAIAIEKLYKLLGGEQ